MISQVYKVCAPGYVAAVIQGTYQLSLWLMNVPRSRLDTLRVESMTGAESYPLNLVEFKVDGNGPVFAHANSENLQKLKGQLKACGSTILATYVVDKDFLGDPKNPGKDYMGVLDHVHEEL